MIQFTRSIRRGAGRYALLFAALTLVGLLYPLLGQGTAALFVWQGAFWLMLVATIRACAKNRRIQIIAEVLFALSLILRLVEYGVVEEHLQWLRAVEYGVQIAFFLVTLRSILEDVLSSWTVDEDQIFGAACGYFLIGVTFAYVFALIETLSPGSFMPAETGAAPLDSTTLGVREFLYLSFVTLSTLGYGDVLPKSDIAKVVAPAESLFGQLFLAVLVARLVGLHVAQVMSRRIPRPDKDD